MPHGSDPGGAPVPPPLTRDAALFLDFDGTLIDLAPTPNAVTVPPALPRLLAALSDRLGGAVGIVSGRPLAELARRLAPFAGVMAGQHGGEIRHRDGSLSHSSPDSALVPSRDELAHFAARHRGVLFEDKGVALALHYRRVPALADTCRAIARQAVEASDGRLRAIEGNHVVELMPRTIGKDAAISTLAAEPPFSGRLPYFIGDDVTDEDGFAVVERLGGVTIKVGAGETAARYRVADVDAVWDWLSRGTGA